ncbi:MAG TPA: DUF6183 family protein [Acidimicrobiales bacterium]
MATGVTEPDEADGPAGANRRLVEQGDLDELVRHIDRLVSARQWDGLVDLRDRCRLALERGKQLWPAASLAEYRLALDAPGPWAGAVVLEGAGHLALGPLSEVAASSHTWDELAPTLAAGPARAMVAHERIVRGENLTGDDRFDARMLDLPLQLLPWEPAYPVATYRPDAAEFPRPATPPLRGVELRASPDPDGGTTDDAETRDALLGLVRSWTSGSNGRAEVASVVGDAGAAVAALGPRRIRWAEIGPADALALMAWTAASGGAHGRRRGMAAGRFEAWWALTALTGLSGEEGSRELAEELGDAARELAWFVWDAGEPDTGWRFHLAVEDPTEGLAWAIAATDASA